MPDGFVKIQKAFLKKQKYPTWTSEKNAQKIKDDFNKAKEKIRQNLIASDTSKDNSVIYTAITQFKKTNG